MQANSPDLKITTDEYLRETAVHGKAEYPFQYYLENVWDFESHSIGWHWHEELEFAYVRSGSVTLSAGGCQITVPAGSGVFINSRVVHRFSANGSALMPNFVFSPCLLAPEDSLIYRDYVRPVIENAMPCILFSFDTPWQAQILGEMEAVFSMHEAGRPNELQVLRRLLALWDTLAQHTDRHEKSWPGSTQARLQLMLQYIHDHYTETITLKEIADAVYISKSSALQIFRDGIQQSPIAYLIQYRLNRAARLLRTTDKSVTRIAEESGFENVGYFCRKFRELFCQSPGAYRKSKRFADRGTAS